ncbi:MAG: hypothetical protein KBG15_21075 [Kofleriaceae bacterium]|nr:hypothetical protein [Kofleriaceae bacterium]
MSAAIASVALLALLLITGNRQAFAEAKPEKVFAGQVFVSDKVFPTTAKSSAAYIAAVKKQKKTAFQEDKETQSWKIYYAAFLKAGLDDVQVNVKLYDVSGRQQQLLAAFEQYTDTRGQRTVIAKFTLERKSVGVNKQVLMVMESNGKVLASGRFQILGETERNSGKVDFTDDEAAGRDGAAEPPAAVKDDKKKR